MNTEERRDSSRYMEDAAGRLVPVETIRPIDLLRDALVAELVSGALDLSAQIRAFKTKTFADIAAFADLSAEQYGVQIGRNKGNITLTTFNGRYKVIRAVSERVCFDERLQAAKVLIDQCITDWSSGSRPELQVLVNNAFQVDQAGNINVGRVLSLRRLQIEDPRWLSAMQAMTEAVQVVDSKSYLRIYERDATGEYRLIPVDVAGV